MVVIRLNPLTLHVVKVILIEKNLSEGSIPSKSLLNGFLLNLPTTELYDLVKNFDEKINIFLKTAVKITSNEIKLFPTRNVDRLKLPEIIKICLIMVCQCKKSFSYI